MARRILLIIVILLLLLLFVAVPSVSWAQELQGNPLARSADRLAEKIAAVTGKGKVQLELESSQRIRAATSRRAEQAVVRALNARGLEWSADSGPRVTVAMEMTAQGLLLVAMVERGDEKKVFIEFAGPVEDAPGFDLPVATLQAELLWQQREMMLDIRLETGNSEKQQMIVLEPETAVFYARENSEWKEREKWPLFPFGSMRRDPWGRLEKQGEEVFAFVAGYPRNMFLLNVRGKSAENFSPSGGSHFPIRNIISWRHGERLLEVQSLGDGETRILEDGKKLLFIRYNWGSEFAVVDAGCGRGSQLLVTGDGDWTEPDVVSAIGLEGNEAVPVAAPLALPGPVLAMRTGEDRRRAIAIVRNLSSGQYEAYAISISCRR
ncbi:MAG TPA: hypothetical protein VNL38_00360 [Candidatus Nitrosotenuis sp.]|nr:hypothetical protein [Candidatus Nitrosotenuis sp.]